MMNKFGSLTFDKIKIIHRENGILIKCVSLTIFSQMSN